MKEDSPRLMTLPASIAKRAPWVPYNGRNMQAHEYPGLLRRTSRPVWRTRTLRGSSGEPTQAEPGIGGGAGGVGNQKMRGERVGQLVKVEYIASIEMQKFWCSAVLATL